MLIHPTLDQLHGLGLHGMAKAFSELVANDEAAGLGHACGFRADRARHSDLMPPTVPI